MSFRKHLTTPGFYKGIFVVSLATLFFVSSISYKQMDALNDSEEQVRQSDIVSLKLEQVVSFLSQAEAGQRGYIISKDRDYLEPFTVASGKIKKSFDTIRSYIDRNSVQWKNVSRLDSLMSVRLASLKRTMEEMNTPGFRIQLYNGRQIMKKIRILKQRIISVEAAQLKARLQHHREALFFTPLSSLLISIFSLFIFVLSFVKINNDRKKMTILEQEAKVGEIIRENEELYRRLIEGLPAALYMCDTNGHIKLYNTAAVELWGREPEIGKDMWCGSWKNYRTNGLPMDVEECPMTIALREKRIVNTEIIIERPDGIKRHVVPHPQLTFDGNGNPTGALNMLIDVTDQRQSQQALEESEIRLRIATEGTRLATWDLDLRTRSIIYSPRLNAIFGQEPDHVLTHQDMREQIHPDDRAGIVEKAFREALETSIYSYESRLIRPNGDIAWIKTEGKVLFDDQGIPSRMLGTMLDITEQKESQEKLIKSEKLFKSIALNIPNSLIVVIDKEYRVMAIEGDLINKLGYDPVDYEGKHLSEVSSPEQFAASKPDYDRVLGGEKFSTEAKIGTGEDFIFHIVPLNDDNGETYAGLVIGLDITDFKQIQNKLTALGSIVQFSDDAIISKTLEGVITSWNESATRIFGYTEAEMIGEHITKLLPSDRLDEEPAILEQLKKGNRVDHFETIRQRKNGEKIDISLTISPIKDGNGVIIGASKIARDITEQKKAERLLKDFTVELERNVLERTEELKLRNFELQQQKDFAETILDTSIDLVIVYSKDYEFIAFNKTAEEIYGKKKSEVLGKKVLDVFPESAGVKGYTDLVEAMTGKMIHNTRYKSPISNLYYEDFMIPLKNENEETYAVLVIARDITHVVENEELLKELNQRLQLQNDIFNYAEENALMGSYAWNLETGALSYSDNMFRIVGCDPNEFVPCREEFLKYVHPDDRGIVEESATSVTERINELKDWKFRMISKDNRLIHVKGTGTLIHSNNERMLVGTIQDVTTDALLNDALTAKNLEMERSNAELASFNHVASHDLQEPLRKIQTFISRIMEKESAGLSERGMDYFGRIQSSANRMQRLIDDLLTFSQTNRDQPFEKVDLNTLVETVRKDLLPTIEDKNAVVMADNLPKLQVIPFQFHQLFTNLISNALKYSKADVPPVVHIRSAIVKAENVSIIPAAQNKEFYQITVSDNGIGFEQQYAENIFVLFQRLHGKMEYTGTGIGLTICRKIVENHNGYITAEGKPGEGSTFTMFFPV